MSELPDGIQPAREPEPQESSAAIVVHPSADGWQVLLGTRSRKSRFMPSHLSFPGGGLEAHDRVDEPGAFERCASRELREETGLDVEPGRWSAAGVRTTPPMFPVRFHTHFFLTVVDRPALPDVLPSPAEIEALRFDSAAQVLREWDEERVRIPPPVLPILRVLAESDGGDLALLVDRIREANALEQRSPRIEFCKDLWMLPVRTATLPPATHTNVWLPGASRFAVVDPGSTEPEEQRRLETVIERRVRTGSAVDCVVLTHHHRDHVGGAVRLSGELDLPVRAHPETIGRLAETTRRTLAGKLAPLHDGEEIELGGLVLRAVHTPGHAPGHLALEMTGTGGWLTGDLLSGLSTILIHPGEGDMNAYLESLERVRDASPARLYPGHGPPLPGRALDKLIAHRLQREGKIVSQLSEQASALSAIAARAYDDAPAHVPEVLIEGQTLAHLLALERRGRARPVDPGRRMWVGV